LFFNYYFFFCFLCCAVVDAEFAGAAAHMNAALAEHQGPAVDPLVAAANDEQIIRVVWSSQCPDQPEGRGWLDARRRSAPQF
jgi:hypothetical protein